MVPTGSTQRIRIYGFITRHIESDIMPEQKGTYIGTLKKGRLGAGVVETEYGLTFSLSKSYKDKKTDEWKDTNWFASYDLFTLKELIDELITKFEIEPGQQGTQWYEPKEEEAKAE